MPTLLRRSRCVAALLATIGSVSAEGLYKAGSPVTSYTQESQTPKGAGDEQPFTLLELYSSWCGHCQVRRFLHA